MLIAVRFDPATDPWGTAMLACVALCGFALVWWIVALAMRQRARGAGRTMSVGLSGYLVCALGGTTAQIMATPPPAPPAPPAGPPVVLEAKVPVDPDEDPKDAKVDAKTGTKTDAEVDAKAESIDAKAEPIEEKAEPIEEKAELAPTPDAKADAKAEPAITPTAADAPATPDVAPVAEAAPEPVDLGPPTLAGREALRFIHEVASDEAKCADAKQVSAAVRELAGALSDVPRARVEKAAKRLETCRRKIVWARAYVIRRHRVEDREALAEALPARLKADGIAVQVSLRGAAQERIRIGGASLHADRAKALLDGGLRDELADVGFSEIVLADMKQSIKDNPTIVTDSELAERELASLGLGRKIVVP